MGSPVSPIVANLYMEYFEQKTLSTGGSHLSRTAVKPDSHLAWIFSAKFLCIIKLIIII